MKKSRVKARYVAAPYQDAIDHGRMILRDGSTALVRRPSQEDRDRVALFFNSLDADSSANLVFASGLSSPEPLLTNLFEADTGGTTLLVTRGTGPTEEVVGCGFFIPKQSDPEVAQVTVAVRKDFQGRGVGTLLVERLSILASRDGVFRFIATSDSRNSRILEVFRNSGLNSQERKEGEVVKVDLSLKPNEESLHRSEVVDRMFTRASMRPFFHPKAVAVIGATNKPHSIGLRVMEALTSSHFNGPVYPVNPKRPVISSIRAVASVQDIPEPIDLAVVVVPREQVLEVIDACGRKGVRSLVIISAGFAESDARGKELQSKVQDLVRSYGMRMIGPNCLGILNTHPDVRLNASFSPVYPEAGNIAMSSQSGALGLAILGLTRTLGLGLSTFVSIGNKADVTGNDLLQYWEEDPETSIILLYMESFGNPRRFSRIARRVSHSKPIVAVKSGRSNAGSRAAGSHTAALAASDVAVDALYKQTGVIRADTLNDMFDLAAIMADQPLPRGRRVGIVTNAGGPGILCTDSCEAGGLEIPEFSDSTKELLRGFLPSSASLTNPIDMIASASPEHYRKTVEAALADPAIDSLIVIYIPVGAAENSKIEQAVLDAVVCYRSQPDALAKPVYACMMTPDGKNPPLALDKLKIPSFAFPESIARALSKVVTYAEWKQKPSSIIPEFAVPERELLRQEIRQAVEQSGNSETWLDMELSQRLLTAYGLPVAGGGFARTAEEACALASKWGFPAVVKLVSKAFTHKTDVGGVKLNLKNKEDVTRAFGEIEQALMALNARDAMQGVWVQPMLRPGTELLVGVMDDPLFGPLLAFGLGGINVEIMKDVVFRITPLTESDASEMIDSIRGRKLLEGYRGHPPADKEALKDCLLKISQMVEEIPEIKELDINPLFAYAPGEGCALVDCRIRARREIPSH